MRQGHESGDRACWPASPARSAAEWVIDHTRAGGERLTKADVRRWHAVWDMSLNDIRAAYARVAGDLGAFEVAEVKPRTEFAIDAVFVGADDRRWDWTVEVDREPPHGVERLRRRDSARAIGTDRASIRTDPP